ncbi:FAD-binding domain-containing protein [Papiliotrema laurentii]|uniref:ferric-chelate reductase (NADPH) n=1 Tax=Papiliotrema laurentii TaxID=5418 RepID=A0AAD9L6C1_PAPLA|nr:FAD-binding domain-containing protein [Papiliotrema laurentii]
MVESTHTLLPRNSIEERLLDSTETTPSPPKRRGRGHYWWSAWEATQRNWLYLHTFPRWLYGPETMADALWTIAYTTLMLAFAVATIPRELPCTRPVIRLLTLQAFCQCPLIIVLIQKNNIISFLTGITYQKLNYLHRASSRVALLFSWVHFLLWTPSVWNAGHFSHWYIIFGLIAIFGFTGLWITSFRFVRRVAFEFFLVAHIVFTIVFIGGALFHWYRLGFWMWPCFVIWGLDRLIRGSRLLYHNPPPAFRWSKTKQDEPAGQCEIRLLSQDVMLVTARRKGLRWAAGQHFFLSSPGVSTLPTESHPFSIANVPNEKDEAVFLIRVHSGFTRRLRDRLSGDITTNIPIYLEGPYGSSHSCASYSTVILVAGGTGITFLFSHLLGLLQADTPDVPRHVHLVWHIRHAQDIQWLAPLLKQASTLVQHRLSTRLTLDVHVTKSHRADEPAPAVGLTERLVEEFAPRRFPRHRGSEETGGADEVDLLDEGVEDRDDTRALLPKRRRSTMKQAIGNPNLDSMGLDAQAANLVTWKKGRADLREVLKADLETTTGPVLVLVCGPVQLMHATRRAVRDVATPQRALAGDWPVDFFEETLGS